MALRELALDLAAAVDPVAFTEQAAFQPDPWQAALLRSSAPRTLLLAARQTGKSTVTSALALHEALYRPPALVLLLSPSLRQSGELFRKVIGLYRSIGAPVPAEAESALRLELANGSRIVSLPGHEATVRGFSGVRLLVVDEAARVPDELYYAVRPMLAVSKGRMICLTTPFGKRGFFYEAWTNGGTAWDRVKITAPECPRISPEFLAEERAGMGDWWFKQEYLCEFVETDDQVFAHDLIDAALTADVSPLFGEGSS